MATEDIWILGIHMTKFGKHPDKDTVDLGAERVLFGSDAPGADFLNNVAKVEEADLTDEQRRFLSFPEEEEIRASREG